MPVAERTQIPVVHLRSDVQLVGDGSRQVDSGVGHGKAAGAGACIHGQVVVVVGLHVPLRYEPMNLYLALVKDLELLTVHADQKR